MKQIKIIALILSLMTVSTFAVESMTSKAYRIGKVKLYAITTGTYEANPNYQIRIYSPDLATGKCFYYSVAGQSGLENAKYLLSLIELAKSLSLPMKFGISNQLSVALGLSSTTSIDLICSGSTTKIGFDVIEMQE